MSYLPSYQWIPAFAVLQRRQSAIQRLADKLFTETMPLHREKDGNSSMSPQNENTIDQLLGSWQLLSIQIRFEDTGQLVDLHGPNPRGFIVFAPGGRVAVVITSGDRQPATDDTGTAALFRDMTAYTGRVRIEDGTMFNEVDVAWQPAWENTPQPRHFMIEGDNLTLTTDVQLHPSHPGRQLRGIIVWAREK